MSVPVSNIPGMRLVHAGVLFLLDLEPGTVLGLRLLQVPLDVMGCLRMMLLLLPVQSVLHPLALSIQFIRLVLTSEVALSSFRYDIDYGDMLFFKSFDYV